MENYETSTPITEIEPEKDYVEKFEVVETNEEYIVDSSYTVLGTGFDKSKGSCPEKETLVKSENGEDHEIVFNEWNIKIEPELDIKEEDLEHNDTRSKSLCPQKENEWSIKTEELDIKQEDLEQNDNSISSHYLNRQDHPRSYQAIQKRSFKNQFIGDIKPVTPPKNMCYQSIQKKDLLIHNNSMELNMFKCDQCDYQALQKVCLRRHRDQCNYQTIDKYSLKQHLRHDQTITRPGLKIHLLRLKNPRKFDMLKCDQCNFQTIYKRNLKRHLLRHKNPEEGMFKCDQCNYQTIDKVYLKMHILRHKNPKEVDMLKCDQCNDHTIYKVCLKKHLIRYKNFSESNMFKCHQCDYQTVEKSHLKSHLLRHKNPKEVDMFKCDQCNYHSKYKASLKRHLISHINYRSLYSIEWINS